MPGRIINSLVQNNAATADDRRLLANVLAANGAPTEPTDGVHTRGHNFIHIIMRANVTTADWTLWVFSEMSQCWCIDTTLQSVPLDAAAADNPSWNTRETVGIERVYIELDNFGAGADIDAWVGGIGGFADHVGGA